METELLSICSQMLAGLAYIHGRHCVHRDLKPMNVLRDGRRPVNNKH